MNAQSDRASNSPIWRPFAPRLQPRSEYTLGELLRFDDGDFVDVAYQTLLRRDPDRAGRDGYLTSLRNGAASKVEILGAIRFSAEGRHCGVHVDGLLVPFKLHRLRRRRVIGPVVGFVMAVCRLPQLATRLQSIQTRSAQESQGVGTALNQLEASLNARFQRLEQRVDRVDERSTRLEQRVDGFDNGLAELAQQVRVIVRSAVADGFATFGRSMLAGRDRAIPMIRAVVSVPHAGAVDSRHRMPGVDPAAFDDAMAHLTGIVPPAPANAAAGTDVPPVVRSGLAVGRAFRECAALVDQRVQMVEGVTRGQLDMLRIELSRRLEGLADKAAVAQLAAGNAEAGGRIAALERERSELLRQLEGLADKAAVAQLAAGDAEAGERIKTLDQRLLASRREWLHLQLRIDRITAGANNNVQAAAVPSSAPADSHALDAFYVAFEDRFRGSSELIAARCAVYLPVIAAAVDRAGGGPVLDIGCGRGEWLRLLRENNLKASGVDLNESMILECRAAGLEVEEADAMRYLGGLADASLAAVTGMHIIEHIPFPSVVRLFDEVFRVLKPGGVVVFETPNPENIDVGACSFYMDPTHLHPLPPPLIEYTAGARGFDEVEIRRLTEYRPVPVPPAIEHSKVPGADAVQWLLDRSRERLSVAPDYAVIAWKSPVVKAQALRTR